MVLCYGMARGWRGEGKGEEGKEMEDANARTKRRKSETSNHKTPEMLKDKRFNFHSASISALPSRCLILIC